MNSPLALLAASAESSKLPFEMLTVFGAAKILGELAEKVKIPAIVGALVAGVIIGPSALGWISDNDLLHALSELGVMFLLFRVGLEVKASEFLSVGQVALIVAMLGVATPMLLGWVIMVAFGHNSLESVFMGAAMVATSVGITAQVLKDKGLLSHRTANVILAAAVIDDVLGLLVLAVVSSMADGGVDVAGLVTTTIVSIFFVVITIKFGTPTVNRVLPRLMPALRAPEAEFGLAMMFLFAMALVAVYSGVAAIIGAFLAGMALAESVSHRVHDLAQGATELLVPFFLGSIGMKLDLKILAQGEVLWVGMLILLAAIFSKWLGCGLGAIHMGWKDASRVGVGMVPRGEVGMVVAQIGLAKGVVGQDVYGIAVFMAVLTTAIAPLLLSIAYKGEALQPVAESLQSDP